MIRIGTVNLKKRFLGASEVLISYLGNSVIFKSITKYVSEYSARVLADGGTVEALTSVTTLAQNLRNDDLFERVTLAIFPSGVKAGKAYSLVPDNGSGDLDVVRNTTATRVNSLGLIETVAANVPRIVYTSGEPAILVESQRTNLFNYSEQFDNSYWNKVGNTIVNNATTSPSGLIVAEKFIASTGTTDKTIRAGTTITIGTNYTFSCYAKKSEFNFFMIRRIGSVIDTYFNLNTGTLGTVGSGVVAKIEDAGNGWFRCIANFTPTSGSVVELALASVNNVNTVTGDGTSGIFIWGAQLEVGANASSYIPTVGSAVTRNQDLISKTGIGDLIGQSEGVFFAHIKNTENNINNSSIALTSQVSSNSNRIFFRMDSQNRVRVLFQINSSIQYDTTQVLPDPFNFTKIALKYQNNNFKLFLNGALVNSNTTGQTFNSNVLNSLAFNDGVSNALDGSFKQIQLYKTALTDAECVKLTTL